MHPKHSKRHKSQKRGHPEVPSAINEVWTMDFTSDWLEAGRSFRTHNVIDILTHRSLGIEVDTSLSSERVVRVMEQLTQNFGIPKLPPFGLKKLLKNAKRDSRSFQTTLDQLNNGNDSFAWWLKQYPYNELTWWPPEKDTYRDIQTYHGRMTWRVDDSEPNDGYLIFVNEKTTVVWILGL